MSKDNDEIDFLDSLEADPPKVVKARPDAVGSPAPSIPSSLHRLLEFAGVALISGALAAGLVAWRLGPRNDRPPSAVDPVALGRAFAPKLARALADGFDAGAGAIEAGKSLGEGDAIIKATFHSSRSRAFHDHAGRAIRNLVPDGEDFKDNRTRKAMADLFTGFAKGLREAK